MDAMPGSATGATTELEEAFDSAITDALTGDGHDHQLREIMQYLDVLAERSNKSVDHVADVLQCTRRTDSHWAKASPDKRNRCLQALDFVTALTKGVHDECAVNVVLLLSHEALTRSRFDADRARRILTRPVALPGRDDPDRSALDLGLANRYTQARFALAISDRLEGQFANLNATVTGHRSTAAAIVAIEHAEATPDSDDTAFAS
jgi:hypothetical protein